MYNIKHTVTPVTFTSGKIDNQKEIKRMGFFQRWLLKQVQYGHEIEKIGSISRPIPVEEVGRIDQPERALRFTVYHANGGRVVETHRYDRKMDRNHNSLYVITSDKDFGKEIDKIITLESLK